MWMDDVREIVNACPEPEVLNFRIGCGHLNGSSYFLNLRQNFLLTRTLLAMPSLSLRLIYTMHCSASGSALTKMLWSGGSIRGWLSPNFLKKC